MKNRVFFVCLVEKEKKESKGDKRATCEVRISSLRSATLSTGTSTFSSLGPQLNNFYIFNFILGCNAFFFLFLFPFLF